MICKKEWLQFFSSLTGYIALAIFLLLTGLFLFVFPDTNILNYGYASLTPFFDIAPYLLLFFIPSITMRSMADEYKQGCFERLKTLPITPFELVAGKFLGAFLVCAVALLPTVVYAVSLQVLSSVGGIDIGGAIGSYIGLLLLAASFTGIGVCASSFTNNTIAAFIAGAFACFILFMGFEAISKLDVFKNGFGYYVELFGINFHYRSINRGVIDIRDVLYFLGLLFILLQITVRNVLKYV